MIDLQTFCGGPYSAPFSQGDYTYATDGNLVVRVPRRSEVPLNLEVPMWELAKDFAKADVARYCELEASLRLEDEWKVGVAWFDVKYMLKLETLPGLQVAHAGQLEPMPFRFEGGLGLLMPMRPPIKRGNDHGYGTTQPRSPVRAQQGGRTEAQGYHRAP